MTNHTELIKRLTRKADAWDCLHPDAKRPNVCRDAADALQAMDGSAVPEVFGLKNIDGRFGNWVFSTHKLASHHASGGYKVVGLTTQPIQQPPAPANATTPTMQDALDAGDAIIARESEKPMPPWLLIESAPKDGEEILLFAPFGDIGVCYWREDEVMTGWTWGMEKAFNRPTHWMPLPEAPANITKEQP